MKIEVAAMLFALLFLLSSPAAAAPDENATTPAVDPTAITVSGISAGGIMAHQLHIAYPEVFSGVAVIAGAPWNCSSGNLTTAFARCMATPGADLDSETTVSTIRAAASTGKVGNPALLADDRAWLFHGASDTVVAQGVSDALADVYRLLLAPGHVEYRTDVPAAHHFPTIENGHACDASESPWIGSCGFDAAGQLLNFLYPGLKAPGEMTELDLIETELDGAEAGLADTAYLFLPDQCNSGIKPCPLHVVLHGCGQSAEQIGMTFIEESGYLPWAASNDIVLAFPQVVPSSVNPLACWDWWGYTGADFLTRDGAQMKAVADRIRVLAQGSRQGS